MTTLYIVAALALITIGIILIKLPKELQKQQEIDPVVEDLNDLQRRIHKRMLQVYKEKPRWSKRQVERKVLGEFKYELRSFEGKVNIELSEKSSQKNEKQRAMSVVAD